jgi:hypothetical protein
MPLIQGGPPQWIWERSADFLKSEVLPVQTRSGKAVYELRLNCGMEILCLHFFTPEELTELATQITELLPSHRLNSAIPARNRTDLRESEEL